MTTCPNTWDRPSSPVCKPHRCELEVAHEGRCVCSCGRTHRAPSWDEDELDDIRREQEEEKP